MTISLTNTSETTLTTLDSIRSYHVCFTNPDLG